MSKLEFSENEKIFTDNISINPTIISAYGFVSIVNNRTISYVWKK